MDRYAVMGNPIDHSKSPFIHARFAEQTGERLSYEAICVEPDGFAKALDDFHAAGGKGLNVTLPFKQEAFRLAHVASPRATEAGAVNTIWFDSSGARHGDNTDGVGLVRDLQGNHGIHLHQRRILLVGAGGAARGVIGPLLAADPRVVIIANRTHQRAVELARRFAAAGKVSAARFDVLDRDRFDVVVNATAASLEGEVPPVPAAALAPGAACYDLMYAADATPFVRWAEQGGADASLDGVGMLVEQAAEAFFLWRGKRPETAAVIAALRAHLSAVSQRIND